MELDSVAGLRLPRCLMSALVCVLIAACSEHERAHAAEPRRRERGGAVSLEEPTRAYVRVEPAARPSATAERRLFARVAFDEGRVAAVGSPVSGRVMSVHVVTGAAVQRGDALLTIHSADVAAARAQLAEAHQARLLAESAAARAALLVRQGAGSEAERQQAATALENARAEEARAAHAVTALGIQGHGADYVLRAPIAGTVVTRSVDVGNAVGADQGQPLITIADLSDVWIVADVYEHDLPYVRVGAPARVDVPALGDRVYTGTVSYVGEVVDPMTHAARARVVVANRDGLLRPGIFAEMLIQAPERAVAVVPTSALLAKRDELYVFVESSPNRFVARRVKAGATQGDHVAILEGLAPGEPVVTRGAILLDAEANAF